jgi:hypothetical protein
MNDSNSPSSNARPERPAWNTGKLTGPKPPLRLGHVWLIRAKLQLERRTRDLALFNLAIDSKLRGCSFRTRRHIASRLAQRFRQAHRRGNPEAQGGQVLRHQDRLVRPHLPSTEGCGAMGYT